LGHIRSVEAIAHIVRCFEDPDVVHVHGTVDPIRDIEVIDTELILADLQSVEQRLDKGARLVKTGDKKATLEQPVLEKISKALNGGQPARRLGLTEEERGIIADLNLITLKPVLYACNVSEAHLKGDLESVQKVRELAKKEGADTVVICGSLESEISQMNDADKEAYLKDYGLTESGLDRMAHAGYGLLKLFTYFTAGPKEVRAWTITAGTKAPGAAGKIHSDFEKGFIRADVYHYDDLIKYGSEQKVQEAGLMRLEGKEYVVKDGDMMHFRFNV
jgi:ribosome-binding ATPase